MSLLCIPFKGIKHNLRTKLKYTSLVVLIWVFTTEIAVYSMWPILWGNFHDDLYKGSLKILIAADPQLLGYRYTLPGLLGFIVRWDADRFIRKTHALAHNHLKPDLTFFMGDMFDEGEIATDVEFDTYFNRFEDVFSSSNLSSAVYVPGDNDIGGEHSYPVAKYVSRFNKYFRSDGFIQYKYLEIFKVNIMTMKKTYKNSFPRSRNIRILLSHIPLMDTMEPLAKNSIEELIPQLIISAHEHTSNYFCVDPIKIELKVLKQAFAENFKIQQLNISDGNVHEIMVPTCSYRMGTEKIGFGALQIKTDGTVYYTVYWLPSRLKQLFSYILLGVLVLILLNSTLVDLIQKIKLSIPVRNRM